MELSSLTAVSPVDGRYGDKVSALRTQRSRKVLLLLPTQSVTLMQLSPVSAKKMPHASKPSSVPLTTTLKRLSIS